MKRGFACLMLIESPGLVTCLFSVFLLLAQKTAGIIENNRLFGAKRPLYYTKNTVMFASNLTIK